MEKLKQTMVETREYLEMICKKLSLQVFLEERDFLGSLGMLDQLRREHRRCIGEVSEKLGEDVSDCTTMVQLEEKIEDYLKKCRQRDQEEKVRALVNCFLRITGEADYGFALEPFQKELGDKTTEELLQMEAAGDLDSYRLMLELVDNPNLAATQVEPIARKFDFQVAFGLMGGKYVCREAAAEPAQETEQPLGIVPQEEPVPEAILPQQTEDAVLPPEETPVPETAAAEPPVEEIPADAADAEQEPAFPVVELPALVVDKCTKKPKGESSFFSLYQKSGPELGTALARVAYYLVDEWGCRISDVLTYNQQHHSEQILDRAIAILRKEGFLDYYRLEGEEDLFGNITKAGFSILNKDSLQRKIWGQTRKRSVLDIPNAGSFVRLRKMNDAAVIMETLPVFSVTRCQERDFCVSVLFPEEDKRLYHFPMLYTPEDKPENLQYFMDRFRGDWTVTAQMVILLEVPDGQQDFWKAYFKEQLGTEAAYYVSAWGEDKYEDGSGSAWTLRELMSRFQPDPEPDKTEKEVPVETEPESAPESEPEAEQGMEPVAEVETAPQEEKPEEASVPQLEIQPEPEAEPAPVQEPPEAESEVSAEQEQPAECQEEYPAPQEQPEEALSAQNLARQLETIRDPAEEPEKLIGLLHRLVAEGQTMEALVLAKALSGVSKDDRFQKLCRNLLHGSNLPLQDRDYNAYLVREDMDESDAFDWYCMVSAAFWAACFPKMAYDYNLYFNVSALVKSRMQDQLPEELVSVRNALSLLTNELQELSFKQGDGAGLSAGVLDSLASGAIQEIKRRKLMAAARDKLAAPRSTLALTGFETVMKTIMGPAGEFAPSMIAVAEDRTEDYDIVEKTLKRFTDADGNISEKLLDEYIDYHWDAQRRVEPSITTKYLRAPARPTLQREITRRLEIMGEWCKRNAAARGGNADASREAYRALVGKLQKYLRSGCEAIAPLAEAAKDPAEAAGLCLLRQTMERICAITGGELDRDQDPQKTFAALLTTEYPMVDADGHPLLEESLNELSGMEPWKLLLKHIAAEKDTLEVALQKMEDYEFHSSRYEDYSSAAAVRAVLDLPQEDRTMDNHYAFNACLDQEEAFMGDVRLACAYGQLAEEDKETIFAQLAQYRQFFVADSLNAAESSEKPLYGNYAHYRMMLDCLKQQVRSAMEKRRNQFRQFYEERAKYYPQDQLPAMLQKVRQELENDNLATAEEYLTRFDAGVKDLPQESVYAAEFNFHTHYLSCADWYCMQCEKPEHKNKGPRDWGRRVLLNKNFWTTTNERNSAETILDNWPNRKGDKNNAGMLRLFLNQIGIQALQVHPDVNHPSTNQYEVFVASLKPIESGREDYSHPIAKFGTLQEKSMYIVCLYGCKGAATLIDIMTKKLQLGGNTIVVMDGVVNVLERRRVAAQFKTMTSGQNAFLLIDRVLMLYLAAQDSGNRLNAMLQCTMPYIYEQVYTEGAGAVADEMFMGRIAERKSLCDPNGTCLVYGGRQLGKTALLRRVESINNKPADQRYAIYLDIKEKGSEYFIRELREKLMAIPSEKPLLRGDESDLNQICASLQNSSGLYRQLTVLIDEVDVYFEEIASGNYNAIHPVVILQESLKNKVKFVFAGTHNVAATSKAIEDNADIIKLRQPLCIKPLSTADAMQLIRWPLSYLGFEIGEQQIAMILANTNSYPGLLHLFCNSLVKSICDNYSKYYDAGRGNPPYTVSDDQLRTIFREKDIKREIANRVIATIKVNSKYRVVANLIAFLEYEDQENGTARLYGYTPEEVQSCNVQEVGIREFMPENLCLNDLDALMGEMEKMGILWKNPKTGSYRFRQRDFLGYIGTYNEVLNTLLGGV